MNNYKKNFHHAQELQKQTHNKSVKSRNYASSNKIWLNSKYIKIKQNQKLKTKFFKLFQIFYSVRKQVYIVELFRK